MWLAIEPRNADWGFEEFLTEFAQPQQSTVDPTQMRSTWRAMLQNIELMPQH